MRAINLLTGMESKVESKHGTLYIRQSSKGHILELRPSVKNVEKMHPYDRYYYYMIGDKLYKSHKKMISDIKKEGLV